MLKISILDTPSQRRLVLERKLISPWASELRRVCDNSAADLNGRALVIELRNLTAISEDGENALLELMNEGVKFRCCGVFTKHVLRQLGRRLHRKVQEVKR
ncbi:MAG TPA: hypothetical protein VE957_08820 [Terriglobales bacterium]|nr:hypothetical protein [Terriglobales bacterium]